MAMAVPGVRPRGRARGYTAFTSRNTTEVQRPGDVPYEKKNPSDSIVEAIDNLHIRHGDGVQVEDIIYQVKSSARQKETMQRAADSIYDKCLADMDFIPTASQLCSKLAVLEVDGVKYFRQFVMCRLQKDFQERAMLKNKSGSYFLNRVRFLCRIFQDMRSPDGSPFQIFVVAIYEYLKMLVSVNSSLEECRLFSDLLLAIGKELSSVDNEKMSSVLLDVRARIMDVSTSRLQRAVLLHSLELAIRNWEPLPTNVESYYKEVSK